MEGRTEQGIEDFALITKHISTGQKREKSRGENSSKKCKERGINTV